MLRVGLTGNIATGKSHVSMKFAEMGAHVIEADRIVHELLACRAETKNKILGAFGDGILSGDGLIDRKVLGKIVFRDYKKRLLLNSLVHPAVGEEIQRRISEMEKMFSGGIVIVEAALIVETGSEGNYHRLIVVSCDPALQVSRLMDRDNLPFEEAKARINSQMPIEEKLKFAHYTIDTSGTLRQTDRQVEYVYRDLLALETGTGASGK
ncbi:MAG: dephospho-CoA kinase [Acidobacteria bacterium]|nr:dephospho-CoA kinase [Acidobacteriota bacterium]